MSKINEWLEQDKLTLLEAWARDGLTYEQIANNMGITRETLRQWKSKNTCISDALKKGREIVDIEVENELLKNAKGFYYVEEVVSTKREVIYSDGKRVKEVSEPVVIKINRYKPCDTTAQIFWLKNRKPDQWREKVKFEGNQEEINKVAELLNKITEGANNG